MTPSSVWIPPGDWYELATGQLHFGAQTGETVLNKQFDLSEMGVFVRGGAIIPTIPVHPGHTVGLTQDQISTLVLTIYPGALAGETKMYEDDGHSIAYLAHHYAWTTVKYTIAQPSNILTLSINVEGEYLELPAMRTYVLRLMSFFPPKSVEVNNMTLPYSRFGGPKTWSYDGPDLSVIVDLGEHKVIGGGEVVVEIQLEMAPQATIYGLKGALRHAQLARQNLDEIRENPGEGDASRGALSIFASFGESLTTSITDFGEKVKNWQTMFQRAVDEVNKIKPIQTEKNGKVKIINLQRLAYSKALLQYAATKA